MPASCKKLSPVEALRVFLASNKVVVFEAASDADANGRLKAVFEQLSVQYALVNLAERVDFAQTLAANAEDFGYPQGGDQATQVYLNGQRAGSAGELIAEFESDAASLTSRIPSECIKESLEQRLSKLVR